MGVEPLVSVVTPVYNGVPYIEECIESVLRQTYENWAYTIVDNASTDGTSDIVAGFAARDSRIRHVRHEHFVGAIANHNRAFDEAEATSEFCKALQGDDLLFPECLTEMVRAAQVTDSIGVVSAYRLLGNRVDLVGLPYPQTFATGRDILRQSLLGGPYVTGAPTALLFRTSFLQEREAFYDTSFWHSDTEAAYWMFERMDLGFVHQVLTLTRRQSGTRASWADETNTNGPEEIRFLLRFGPGVLDDAEYRERLNLALKRYVWYHARQSLKPSRVNDSAFMEFHRAELDRILEEANGEPLVKAAVTAVRAMLLRGSLTGLGRAPRRTTPVLDELRGKTA